MPVLRGLRRTFGPGLHVAWLLSTSCGGILRHDGDLSDIVWFDRKRLGRWWRSPSAGRDLWRLLAQLRRGRYDWVLDLQGLLRSAVFARATRAPLRAGFADAREGAGLFYTNSLRPAAEHTVDRNIELARSLGIDARPGDMTLQVSADAASAAESIMAERKLTRGRFLACVPPTRWPTKRYPGRHWRTVARKLSRDLPVVLLGAPDERPMCAEVAEGLGPGVTDLCGRTSLEQMVALIAASGGVVCCDSAAKFIAPAVGVDAVVLIGPTRLERTGPYLRGRAIVADVPCQGCLRRTCRHCTCMGLIAPDAVVSAAMEMAASRNR
jgi:ADP-heptose:LPS heptosyltransferase